MKPKLNQVKSGLKRFNGKLNILVRRTNKKARSEIARAPVNVNSDLLFNQLHATVQFITFHFHGINA